MCTATELELAPCFHPLAVQKSEIQKQLSETIKWEMNGWHCEKQTTN